MDTTWETVHDDALTPTDDKEKSTVKITQIKNIIFVGSELSYDSFWAKMMFIGAATYTIDTIQMTKDAKLIVAYVAEGYTKLELGALELWCRNRNAELKKISKTEDVATLFTQGKETSKIHKVFFFSHGLPSKIKLNYRGPVQIDIDVDFFSKLPSDLFKEWGCVYSFACRTGSNSSLESFSSDSGAAPSASLASYIATRFNIKVRAFLVRTSYTNVIREDTKVFSSAISEAIKELRNKNGDKVIHSFAVNGNEYEALPHDGLSESLLPFTGGRAEGTNGYALWRKKGGRGLPSGGSTPTGLSRTMKTFTPNGQYE